MATTNINVSVDSELKRQAEVLFDNLGLNMSVAITMFLKSAVNYDGIPFEVKLRGDIPVSAASLTREQLNNELNRGIADIKAGRVISADEAEAEIRAGFGV